DHVKMSFRINPHALGTEHRAFAIAYASNRVLKRAVVIEPLHAEIHRVHYHQVFALEPQFGREVELAVAGAALAKLREHAAMHVHHENLIAVRVGHEDVLRRRIHRDARRTLEHAFAALQAADHLAQFSTSVEHEDFARV